MGFTRRINPYLTFLALTISISAIASFLARSVMDPRRHQLVGAAASLDLTLTITLLYHWLLVRPGLRSKSTMFFVALLGLWRASFLFPDIVPGKLWIGGGIEVAVFTAVGAGFWKSRHAVTGGDPVERLRIAFSSFVPVPAAARAMAAECAVLYYGFCSWRSRPHVPAGARAFTMHKTSMANDLLFSVAIVSLLEIVPMHLFLHHWSTTAAWIGTSLSVYGAIWLMSLARAFTLRPTLVSPEGILVRYGLIFQLRIPADQIRSIRKAGQRRDMIIPRGSSPSLYLDFFEPLEAEAVFGIRKRVNSIGLAMDDAAGFENALQTFNSARVLR